VFVEGGAYGGSYFYRGREIERLGRRWRLMGKEPGLRSLKALRERIDAELLEEAAKRARQAKKRQLRQHPPLAQIAEQQGWAPVEIPGGGPAWFKPARPGAAMPRWSPEEGQFVRGGSQ